MSEKFEAKLRWEQLFESIFCEAWYCQMRNLDLAHKTRPYPRGQLFLNRLERKIQELVAASQQALDEAEQERQLFDAFGHRANQNGRILH